jgi:hypothetical protein
LVQSSNVAALRQIRFTAADKQAKLIHGLDVFPPRDTMIRGFNELSPGKAGVDGAVAPG